MPIFSCERHKKVQSKDYGLRARKRSSPNVSNQKSRPENEHSKANQNPGPSEEYFLKMFQQMKSDLLKDLESRIPKVQQTSNVPLINPALYQQIPLQQAYLPHKQAPSPNLWMTQAQQTMYPRLQS